MLMPLSSIAWAAGESSVGAATPRRTIRRGITDRRTIGQDGLDVVAIHRCCGGGAPGRRPPPPPHPRRIAQCLEVRAAHARRLPGDLAEVDIVGPADAAPEHLEQQSPPLEGGEG